jgi:tRNA(Ile)-lysidine synthase
MSLEDSVSKFLLDYYDLSRPVLLGLSGGPDSMALLNLLLKFKQNFPLQLGVAHIDHGWREESGSEAEQLLKLIENHGLPFHLKKIYPAMLEGNLEAACRNERLKFFSELCEKYHYQAVMLAHQYDDQVETVLKRIFEGAGLPQLACLQEENVVDGLKIWRPLLKTKKSEIEHWLKKQGLKAFHDCTNLDPKFLRGRFRTDIIPYLTKSFGKEISNSLCNLAQEAQELKTYLKEKLKNFLIQMKKEPFGSLLDLNHNCPESEFEVKYLLRELCIQESISLSRELLSTASELILSGKSDRHIEAGGRKIYIDRKRIFIPCQELKQISEYFPLRNGIVNGIWQVKVESVTHPKNLCGGWQNVWKGSLEVSLPAGDYKLGPPLMNSPYPGNNAAISKWWTNEKVPAFLRNHVPVIWDSSKIIHEFLTDRPQQICHDRSLSKEWMHITLTFQSTVHLVQ